jgi:hypothetical protein
MGGSQFENIGLAVFGLDTQERRQVGCCRAGQGDGQKK